MLDTNILISASYWFGNPKKIIDYISDEKICAYSSNELLTEYNNSIMRDFGETIETSKKKTDFFESILKIVEPIQIVIACEDKDDNKVLEVAVCANANFIISGDKHLLKMNEFEGIRIVTAHQFIELFTL